MIEHEQDMQSGSNKVPFSGKAFFKRLFWGVAIITALPFLYNYFELASYDYGYSFGGTSLWLCTAILALILWSVGFRHSGAGRSREDISFRSNLKPLLLIAWVGTLLYVVFVFLQRLPSGAEIFDVKEAYDAFGPGADSTIGLSPLGALGAVTAPISLLLIPYSIHRAGLQRLYLAAPAILFVTANLLMGKRQILMFAALLMIFTLVAKGHKFSFRRIVGILLVFISTVALAVYLGFMRSGFGTFETQLYHNSKYLNFAPADYLAFSGLLFLYVGGGAEVLSVATDHFRPTYVPFSVTNTFLQRRINSVIDYVDYERDVVPYTSGVLEYHLGSFGRIWAGGNLQLFAEGGYIWVVGWYVFLMGWFVYIRGLAQRGRAEILDLTVFASVFLHHMFVFPLRDQLIFFTFLYYVLFIVVPRHFRWGRRGS
jgi:oligosaccharide repeat unit polymerase